MKKEMVHTKEMMISQSSSHNRTFTNFRQTMRRITAITAIPQVELHAPIRLADLSWLRSIPGGGGPGKLMVSKDQSIIPSINSKWTPIILKLMVAIA